MAKYNIYAVAIGLDPKTKQPVSNLKFHTWDECKPYVVGVEGAKYKGFLTEAEADSWLAKTIAIPFEKHVTTLKPIEESSGSFDVNVEDAQKLHQILDESYKTATPIPKEKKDSFFDPEFHKMCTDMGIIPMAMVMTLQKQFVAEQKAIKVMQDGLKALKSELPFI